jgi:competence protein ComEC
MDRNSWTILCLAYGIGLLSSGVFGLNYSQSSWKQWLVAIAVWGLLSLATAFFVPQVWRRGPRWQVLLSAGLVAIIALIYLQIRLPRPAVDDISQILTARSSSQIVSVTGKALSDSRRTANNQRMRFWFAPETVSKDTKKDETKTQKVTGKLYVSVPIVAGKGIYPGQKLTMRGVLYRPNPPSNPGAFNFADYLAQEGAFAGLRGFTAEKEGKPPWGLWLVRRRIVKAQTANLNSPEGLLISSMVVGQQAVDLPPEIRSPSEKYKRSPPIRLTANFRKAGLAHILAVSGFQVSLLLGAVLAITGSRTPQFRLIIGSIVLVFYVSLTGFQPSALRAGVMGFGVLVGLVFERKTRPLGLLMLAAILLLIASPLWIYDLGFQLSFLATFGLIVTLPALQKKLDWLPPVIATIVALPIAASLWTLPLLMHTFSVVATYSVPANILSAPLVTVISLGGSISAIAALILPPLGSAIAWLLYYPTHWLIQLVNFTIGLPGSSYSVGKLSLGWMLIIYGLMLLPCLSIWWQKRWQLISLLAIAIVIFPIISSRLNLTQVTVLDGKSFPTVVIEDRGTVILINSGDATTARYTILPFLAQQGINHIDAVIAFQSSNKLMTGWREIEANLSVGKFFSNFSTKSEEFQSLSDEEELRIGNTRLKLISAKPPVLQLQIQQKQWLLLTQGNLLDIIPQFSTILTPQVLLWSGKQLDREWLKAIAPEVAIAVSRYVDAPTRQELEKGGIKLYLTGRDGAIQWTPPSKFQKTSGDAEVNQLGF